MSHILPKPVILIVLDGWSKTYAMTGWRVGYTAGPKHIIDAVIRVQSHCTSNVCSFAQWGALSCYTDPRSDQAVKGFMEIYRTNRDVMYDFVTKIPGVRCHKPDGTFYLFPDISQTGKTSTEFSNWLIDEYQIVTVPGIVFGADNNFRFSFATDLERIEKAANRLLK